MSFTDEQLKRYLLEGPVDDEAEDFDEIYDDWHDSVDEFFYEGGDLEGFGNFKIVASWNLGDGHEQGTVFQHESGRFFKVTGWYSSWDTGEWETVEEVEPYEVTKIRYRKVK